MPNRTEDVKKDVKRNINGTLKGRLILLKHNSFIAKSENRIYFCIVIKNSVHDSRDDFKYA